MKCLIQRVNSASVKIDGEVYSKIGKGILVFLGVEKGDTAEKGLYLSQKIVNLRIFEDENEKMNKSLKDINGEMLVVSQFTLCGDCKKGSRPNFINAENPQIANEIYEEFVNNVKKLEIPAYTGKFGAKMIVCIENDGPVTFLLEK